jgi:uncharacterized protein YjdB
MNGSSRLFLILAATGACGDSVSRPVITAMTPLSVCVSSVTMTPPAVTLSVGDTTRFHASACDVGPNAIWIWTLSNADVASIDSLSSLVTAKKPGAATVIASLADNRAVKTAAALTVIP